MRQPIVFELLERRITSIGVTLEVDAGSAATDGAAGVVCASRLAGGTTASFSEVTVPLVFNECPAEFGAEYPVGSISLSLNGSVRSEGSYG